MEIQVELMAIIKRPNDIPREFSREVDPNTKLRTFLKQLGFESSEIRQMQFFIGKPDQKEGDRVRTNYVLQDGDKLFITIPIGGG